MFSFPTTSNQGGLCEFGPKGSKEPESASIFVWASRIHHSKTFRFPHPSQVDQLLTLPNDWFVEDPPI